MDNDCPPGFFCTSHKQCAKYDPRYCFTNACGIGDAGSCARNGIERTFVDRLAYKPNPTFFTDCDTSDKLGCAPGLVCSFNNCAKFHQIGPSTF